MGGSPGSRPKARSRTAIGVLSVVAFLAALFALASPAGAHHPEISAEVDCADPGPGWQVDFTSESWSTGAQGQNDEIRISYRLRTDGGSAGSWTDLPQKPGYKYDAGNGYEFSDSFTLVPPAGGNQVQVRALAVDSWGNGNPGGQERTTSWMKLPQDCDPRGSLKIEKVETGSGAPGGTYFFDVSGPDGFLVEDVPVNAGSSNTLSDLKLGTYTVTEQNPPPGHSLSPNNGVVEISKDRLHVTVTATNPYPRGSLKIEKVETGTGAPGGTYFFDVSGPDGYLVEDFPVTAGSSNTLSDLKLGTYTVTEQNPPPGHTLEPNGGVVEISKDEQTVTVTATNPYPAGSLKIFKVETGTTAPGGTYFFDVSGPDGFLVKDIPVNAGSSNTLSDLKLGTYTVTEQDPPPNHTMSPPGGVVEITEDGAGVSVTATNPYASPEAEAHTDCAEGGAIVKLANSGDGPASFQIYVDDVPFGSPIELTSSTDTVLVPMTEDQTSVIRVTANGDTIYEEEFTYDCEDAQVVSAAVDCADGGIAIEVTNHGESTATVNFEKDGADAGSVQVPSGATVKHVVPFSEDETAVVTVSTNGETIFEEEFTYDCEDVQVVESGVDCEEGGYVIDLVNDGENDGTVTVTKDGETVEEGVVPAGGTATVLVPFEEDETATVTVTTNGETLLEAEVTYDCVEPTTTTTAPTTTTTEGAEVLPVVVTPQQTLPATGSSDSTRNLVLLGAAMVLLGGVLLLGRRKATEGDSL